MSGFAIEWKGRSQGCPQIPHRSEGEVCEFSWARRTRSFAGRHNAEQRTECVKLAAAQMQQLRLQ
jgi:hypothetical protein